METTGTIAGIINKQIDIINRSLVWINAFLKAENRVKTYNRVVDIRRHFKRVAAALCETPAAAMYGESQRGKSYLVSGLLSEQGKRFTVPDMANSEVYDFINMINPIGNGRESTSLVTRFSIHHKPVNPGYPIKVKLFPPVDLILMLCDSYFNDVKSHNKMKVDELNDVVRALETKYKSAGNKQAFISEDDILDIRDYFKKYFPDKVENIIDSEYFEKLPKIIQNIGAGNWTEVFEVLWNKNSHITDVFSKLINEHSRINFSDTVHIKFETVLREFGTILGVPRLREIYGAITYEDVEQSKYKGDAEILFYQGFQERTYSIKKPILCALASEVVFALDARLGDGKPFLKSIDLLDFPGARARLNNEENNLQTEHIPEMLLRGKVAYFFNKFSDAYLINNLLLCHNHEQSSQRFMPELINNWISNFIGKNAAERELFMRASVVPPLFFIGTMFNIDLKFNAQTDKPNADLSNRWKQRFGTALKEIFEPATYSWLDDWTTSKPRFQNIFLLRDFFWSNHFNIFRGYGESGVEKEQVNPDEYPNFVTDLRSSFINFSFVKEHFVNPVESWDEAGSLNKDGTELIIRNLCVSAANMSISRTEKFKRELISACTDFLAELEKHYHSDEADKAIVNAVQKAGKIQLDLDIAFGKDPYFFGKMMQKLVLSESFVFNYFLNKINELTLIEQSNLSEYAAVRLSNPGLSLTKQFDENLQVLMESYKLPNPEVTRKYFAEKEMDLNELFYGEKHRIKSNSLILSEGLVERWFEEYFQETRFEALVKNGFSETSVTDLLVNIKILFKQLDVTNYIAKNIRKYVDRYDKIDEVLEMIADISVAIINKFINSMGYTYYGDDMLQSLNKANAENNLSLVMDHDYLTFKPMTEPELTQLFNSLDRLDEILNKTPIDKDELKNVPNFSNFLRWKDLLKISFVATCDIPTYDIVANNELGVILKAGKEVSYA